jgi:F0F1-type ATP synthase assembly protein I
MGMASFVNFYVKSTLKKAQPSYDNVIGSSSPFLPDFLFIRLAAPV